MQTLNFGHIPVNLALDEPYPMRLPNSDLQVVADIVNQGIDSHLEAVCTRQEGCKVWILDAASMKTFLRRCVESENERAQELASCIMQTLGFEWV